MASREAAFASADPGSHTSNSALVCRTEAGNIVRVLYGSKVRELCPSRTDGSRYRPLTLKHALANPQDLAFVTSAI